MGALLRSTRAVCSGELSLLSSMSGGGGGGGGGSGGGKEVPADRVQRTTARERNPNRV